MEGRGWVTARVNEVQVGGLEAKRCKATRGLVLEQSGTRGKEHSGPELGSSCLQNSFEIWCWRRQQQPEVNET